jgi:hypothetical protein
MPPLKTRLRSMSPEGYAAQEQLPASTPAPPEPGRVLGANAFIRCPLPPFNVSPDTLRQFNENGKIPARRVIPLPVASQAGGNATIINNTEVTSTSSSASGNAAVVIAAKTVTLNLNPLAPGNAVAATLTVSAVAVLMIVGSSDLCEIRIYGDPVSQSIDVSRLTDTAPAFETTAGLVTDVVLDTTPLQWNWQNRIYVNQDSPATSNLYVTVINPTLNTVTPSITITYLPLE